jgi:hypothetical protein
MRFFQEDLRLLGARCRALGLPGEAGELLAMGRDGDGAGEESSPPAFSGRAAIEPLRARLTLARGQTAHLPVRVVNRSTRALRHGCFPFALSYHLLGPDGTMRQWDNARTWFDEPLRTGESRLMELTVQAPDEAGAYRLELDILWENVAWLKTLGNDAPVVELLVGA